jgi:hypothetical protein
VLEYRCEWCGRSRKGSTGWILGLAGERVGAAQSRREVVILDKWSDAAAGDPLAVYFCCADHQNKYVRELFAGAAQPELQRLRGGGVRLTASTGAEIKRSRKATREAGAPAEPKTRHAPRRKKKPAPREKQPPAFTTADVLRARGMGIALGPAAPRQSHAPKRRRP